MFWSRICGDLSSWLGLELICITTVIHSVQNEKIFFSLRRVRFIPFNKSISFPHHTHSLSISLSCPAFFSLSSLAFIIFIFPHLLPYFSFPLPFSILPSLFFHPFLLHILLSVPSMHLSTPPPPLSPTHTPPPQAVVDGSETSVVLQHLNSLTEYQLAVFAVYANEASEALRGSETTRKFILTRMHARRNVLTKLYANASVNI